MSFGTVAPRERTAAVKTLTPRNRAALEGLPAGLPVSVCIWDGRHVGEHWESGIVLGVEYRDGRLQLRVRTTIWSNGQPCEWAAYEVEDEDGTHRLAACSGAYPVTVRWSPGDLQVQRALGEDPVLAAAVLQLAGSAA